VIITNNTELPPICFASYVEIVLNVLAEIKNKKQLRLAGKSYPQKGRNIATGMIFLTNIVNRNENTD
jgi:hypothetical protein